MAYKDINEKRRKHREYMRLYRSNPINRLNHNKYSRESRQKRDRETIKKYGGRCVCCGELNYKFLTLDHIDGGGNKHREILKGGGGRLYQWARKNNYPNILQILCWNCNMAKAKNNNICPHNDNK